VEGQFRRNNTFSTKKKKKVGKKKPTKGGKEKNRDAFLWCRVKEVSVGGKKKRKHQKRKKKNTGVREVLAHHP